MRGSNACLTLLEGNDLDGFLQEFARLSIIANENSEYVSFRSDLRDQIREFSRESIEKAFSNPEEKKSLDFWQLLRQIPRHFSACSVEAGHMLLIPIDELMRLKFSPEHDKSSKQFHEFYSDVDIYNQWYRSDPRLWSSIGSSFDILAVITEVVQTEIESSDPSLNISTRLNSFLQKVNKKTISCSITEFCSLFNNLPELYDLLSLELFLETYPNEIYLPVYRNYKSSFARKIGLICIKQFVNIHQCIKKNRSAGGGPAPPMPKKDKVIDCCITANLDITCETNRDPDIRYFWSYLRKSWLHTILKSNQFSLFEIYDHIESDDVLVNQLFLDSVDRNNTEEIATLLVWNEDLRFKQFHKRQLIDDPQIQMYMSFMQQSRFDQRIAPYGPSKKNAFIMPFSDKEIHDDHGVYVIESPTQLEKISLPSVVVVDVFYKAWISARLERPLPTVVAIATEKKVYLIMVARIVGNSKSARIFLIRFFTKLFQNQSILKVINSTRGNDKAVILSTLLTEDPFNDNSPVVVLSPILDLSDLNPTQSFPSLVSHLLGGIEFCDFEENSNWNQSSGFLRDSQIHYIASRTWLSLQLFHTLEERDVEEISGKLFCMHFANLGRHNFWSAYPRNALQVNQWIACNPVKLIECANLVQATQHTLRAQLSADLLDDQYVSDDLITADDFCL